MVSLRALRAYMIINSMLLSLAYVQHVLTLTTTSPLVTFIAFLLRNFLLLSFVEVLVNKRPMLASNSLSSSPSPNIVIMEVAQASLLENITYLCIPHQNTTRYLFDILCFIPLSFIFEVAFDFFHYWTHRICHMHPWLYRQTHKKHHEHCLVSPHTTYHQHYLDIILTNSIPFILTYWMFPFKLSSWQLHMMLVYKTFVEISGHCGRVLYPASSFPQFIWLPRVLGVSLYAEDHHIHHTKIMFNFGKRFSLWDKLFNTYHCGFTSN